MNENKQQGKREMKQLMKAIVEWSSPAACCLLE